MTDRPIIFSAPMIRALLEGRKSQTRRVLKLAGRAPDYIGQHGCQDDPTCWGWEMPDLGGYVTVEGDDKDHLPGWRNGWRDWQGAYATGDRLYVREAHAIVPASAYRMSEGVEQVVSHSDRDRACIFRESFDRSTGGFRWRPSIHMPRWASRLTLTVTDVRVQRLQDISEADAIAEGAFLGRCKCMPPQKSGDIINRLFRQTWCVRCGQEFRDLWNSLHGPGAWDQNPWVCALTFTTEQRNIDGEPVLDSIRIERIEK